jgi:hypothetical protein
MIKAKFVLHVHRLAIPASIFIFAVLAKLGFSMKNSAFQTVLLKPSSTLPRIVAFHAQTIV